MPRTKQTKPRHIIEDQKSNEIFKGLDRISSKDSKLLISDPEKHEEINYTDPDSSAFESVSPKSWEDKSDFSNHFVKKNVEEMESRETATDYRVLEKNSSEDEEDTIEIETKEEQENNSRLNCDERNEKSGELHEAQSPTVSPSPSAKENLEDVTSEEFITNSNPTSKTNTINNADHEREEDKRYCDPSLAENDQNRVSLLNDVSAAYLASLKSLLNGKITNSAEPNEEIWKAWFNNTNPLSPGSNNVDLNHSSLVNDYIKKLVENWNLKLKDISEFQNVYTRQDSETKANPSKFTSSMQSNSETINSNAKKEVSENCKVSNSEATESSSTETASKSNDTFILSNKSEKLHFNKDSNRQAFVNDGDKSKQQETTSAFENNKLSFPVYSNSMKEASYAPTSFNKFYPFLPPNNLLSSSSLPKINQYGQLHPGPLYPYNPWVNPSWLNYNTHHINPFSNYFPHQPTPPAQKTLKEKSSRLEKNVTTGIKNRLVDNDAPKFYKESKACTQNDSFSNQKFSDKKSDPQKEITGVPRTFSDVPYMPYNPVWLGPQLPSKLTPPRLDPILGYPQKYSGLYFSPERQYTMSPRLSPSMDSYSTAAYKRETVETPPTMGAKMLNNRRAKAQGPAIDSVHAAIVREAKEQSKGVDPENMYIQCPICHKRIKRLYHFQRHMRIHTGEKIHQCPCCQYKSVRKDNLKSHMKTHEKQNLEGGRKGGKSSYQGGRYSFLVNEKLPSRPSESNSNTSINSTESVGSPHQIDKHLTKNSYKRSQHTPTSQLTSTPSPSSELNVPLNLTSNGVQPKSSLKTDSDQDLPSFFSPSKTFLNQSNFLNLPAMNNTNQRLDTKDFPDVSKIPNATKKRELQDLSFSPPLDEEIKKKRLKFIDENNQSPTDLSQKNAINTNNNNAEISNNKSQSSVLSFPFPHALNKSIANVPDTADVDSTTKPVSKQYSHDNRSKIIQREETALGQKLHSRSDSEASDPDRLAVIKTNDLDNGSVSITNSFSNSGETSVADECENQTPNDESESRSEASSNSVAGDFFKMNLSGSPYFSSTKSILKNFYEYRHPMFHSGLAGSSESSSKALINSLYSNSSNQFKIEKNADREKLFPNSEDSKSKSLKLKSLQDASLSSKLVQCRLCSFATLSNVELQTHVTAKHKQDGFYKCEECTYLGKNLSKLVEHIRIHTGERPFKCDQCSYAAKRKDNLAQHKAVRHDKRKAKSSGQYTTLSEMKTNPSFLPSTTPQLRNAQGSKESRKGLSTKSQSFNSHSDFFSQVSLYEKLSSKKQELNKLSGGGAFMTPFHSIPPIHNFPPSLFQFPYYHQFSPVISSSDIGSSLPVSAPRTVNSPGPYSVNVRPALIAP